MTSQAGGKGVNISRASVSAGEPTLAVLPAAKDDPFVMELLAAGIDCRPVPPAGDVRVNITITEPDGTTTKLNSPGATVEAVHLEAMASTAARPAPGASWTVLAGSAAGGRAAEFYAELVRRPARLGAKVAVDTSEAPLRALVDALPDSAPDLMKPNGDELASFTGGDADELENDPRKAAVAARTLIDRGVGTVLATLGGNGAVLVTAEGAWHAAPPPTTVVSTVGAGDSSLFGYLLGDIRGLPAPDRLATRRGLRQRRRRSARHHHPRAGAPSHRARHRHCLGRQRMTDLITTQLVRLDASWGAEKADARVSE